MKIPPNNPKIGNVLVQLIIIRNSIQLKWQKYQWLMTFLNSDGGACGAKLTLNLLQPGCNK